jgi:hypothetical protein
MIIRQHSVSDVRLFKGFRSWSNFGKGDRCWGAAFSIRTRLTPASFWNNCFVGGVVSKCSTKNKSRAQVWKFGL